MISRDRERERERERNPNEATKQVYLTYSLVAFNCKIVTKYFIYDGKNGNARVVLKLKKKEFCLDNTVSSGTKKN